MARCQPIEQRRSGTSKVKVARGGRGKSNTHLISHPDKVSGSSSRADSSSESSTHAPNLGTESLLVAAMLTLRDLSETQLDQSRNQHGVLTYSELQKGQSDAR